MPLPPILFEDEALVAFDKPGGVEVMAEIRDRLGRHVANVHRLEVETSGVLLCAKTKAALDSLSGQFQAKRVEKKHLALVSAPESGLEAEFTVDLALGPDEAHPGRTCVHKRRGGRPSLTEFRVLESFGRFAWLECRPATGRNHQIRAHLAAVGAPVLNDALYGRPEVRLLLSDLKRGYKGREEERPLLARLALHASGLTFAHPVTGEAMTVNAPLPREFEIALKYLRKFGAFRTGSV